ncbi:MAG: hypothetical protein A2745_03020 [Candidatus Harrisonbacteria bacterium RIFCSPHIGHO2_01_FULL_44_13]|uniref:TrbC/VIRB2 family protein n=1 Tax=Candidatus Harrisonbacteria bacterium RIFCSPLOWO2_01_FULL_44_18 TaxID=1798407 RepID=A0A1G1ZM79_9BACT|nr:MAG: hypothetical protein A2745_03020 [Candidatus Harrisonbacteria bacterium RIFCSPHIGHO2_01_FULL_44_13]OGY65753.1 MAG: hypothetical protein A3A16_04045 [Candidatus Harrisonbacteria bacterium RIFCSPLOWO2_01_FULL_44_18]
MKNLLLFISLLLLLSFSFANLAFAQGSLIPCKPQLVGGELVDKCTFADLVTLVRNVIDWFLTFVIPLAAVFIIYGGFVIMFAGGDPGKAKKGREIITAAVIGIAIAMGTWLIVTTAEKILKGLF